MQLLDAVEHAITGACRSIEINVCYPQHELVTIKDDSSFLGSPAKAFSVHGVVAGAQRVKGCTFDIAIKAIPSGNWRRFDGVRNA